MKSKILVFALLSFSFYSFAQNDTLKKERYTAHNKGKFTISWGGNRGSYTKSDITFKGDNYNFTIDNTVAHDKPKGWHVDYLNPSRMTIPQTNFKLGYFITDKYSVSIGVDHMKYVMTQNQTANVSGEINFPLTNPSSQFNGSYNNTPVTMTEDFLMFEHTDGLNYINVEFARQDDISHWFGIKNTDKFQVNINEGIGIGVLYPKTNTTLMGQERHDAFHVSGYGTSIKAGINFVFFKYFTIEGTLKGGYINMPDIRTTKNSSDSASQHFFFGEKIISFGGIFRL
ncbi:hypothetical protein [Flavobacterium eburneipallidum]|uniref:hypothetical protein n=1 Tax=Flavobacterium eburneipallidum TaxID=3003263 RepID=UPI0024821461|nr:hypothetical protein [Flavobacterium eburneipallidum]